MEDKVIGNINSIQNGSDIGIKSENSPFAESFYFVDIYDDKAVKKFIKSVERLVRQSREYKTYIELLRTNNSELNHDSILGNITTADVDLEFHHYPLSLYDIIYVIVLNSVVNNIKFTSFSIAKEVMENHYSHYIGLVPMTKTTHEIAHKGDIFIRSDQVFGNYRNFISKYSSGMTQELLNKVLSMEKLTEDGVPSDFKRMF